MADTTKPTEVPAAAPAAVEPVVAAPEATTETPAPAAEVAAPAATETTAPAATETEAATETAAPAVEEVKEPAPIEEGFLESKGSKFPQNFIYTKRFFWFGTEAVEPKTLASYVKSEKSSEAAQGVAAWASNTGKGLLFYAEKSEKASPAGAILLSEATEPSADGPTKFHFTAAKGHKHTFKAANAAERDSWVATLKVKITEAKELAATVTESEVYKSTIESYKPAPPAKKEEPKAEETAAEAAAVPAVAAAAATTEEPAKETEAPKAEEAAAVKEEKKEEPKRRSASRKRASIFGSLLGGKKEEKKVEETKEVSKEGTEEETKAVEGESSAVAATTETPAVAPVEAEAPVATETPAVAPVAETEAPVKPVAAKRNSIFSNLSFGSKKKPATDAPASPAAETPAVPAKDTTPIEPVAETAPVIPASEPIAPLSAEVASPATVPTETVEVAAPTNGESATKPEIKSDKRKSSLPFGFGAKKEKAATSDEEGEAKPKSPSAFSKLRATIKGKGKAAEKPAEKPAVTEEGTEEATKDATKEAEAETSKPAELETPAPATEAVAEEPKPVAATPVVAATA